MTRLQVALGRLLLRFGLRRDDREFLRGDLEEELAVRRADPVRRASAGHWYLSQAARAALSRRVARALHERVISQRWDRDRQGDGMLKSWLQDFRFSFRTLRREPGFALATLLTLGLGIGATATMFTFFNGMLLRPLPYPDGHRLVAMEHISSRGGVARANYLNYLDWVDRTTSFESTAAYYEQSFNISTDVDQFANTDKGQGIL